MKVLIKWKATRYKEQLKSRFKKIINNEIPGKIITFGKKKKKIIRLETTEKFSQYGNKYVTRLKLVRLRSCVKGNQTDGNEDSIHRHRK